MENNLVKKYLYLIYGKISIGSISKFPEFLGVIWKVSKKSVSFLFSFFICVFLILFGAQYFLTTDRDVAYRFRTPDDKVCSALTAESDETEKP